MEKDRGITIIGHANHGRTTLVHSVLQAMSQACVEPLILSGQGNVGASRYDLKNISESMMNEYILIKKKQSKLPRRKRDYIVSKVEESISK